MGIALEGSLLVAMADSAVAGAFCSSRFAADRGLAYDTLSREVVAAAIVERHRPRL
jgi:hypothetical protein